MSTPQTPLVGPPPAEVLLNTPPLVRVIVQVRFPVVASIEKQDFIAAFQEVVRAEYPVLRPEKSRTVLIGPDGVPNERSNTMWRFFDAESVWRVTLAPDFLALETSKYTNRNDFLARFRNVLLALEEHVNPRVVDRLGVRYVDRIVGENVEALPQLVRPEVAGVLSTPLFEHALQSINESAFDLPDGDGRLTTRWGLLPAGTTYDPGSIGVIDERAWVFDVDAYQSETRALEIDAIVSQARAFAERIYSVFRWAVTDEFLKRYGGEP